MPSQQEVFRDIKKAYRRYRMLDEVEHRKYYQGFRVGREKKMFEEELEDIENTYKSIIKELNMDMEVCLHPLIHYMEEFVNLHKKKDVFQEKLDALSAKTGRSTEEDEEEDDE